MAKNFENLFFVHFNKSLPPHSIYFVLFLLSFPYLMDFFNNFDYNFQYVYPGWAIGWEPISLQFLIIGGRTMLMISVS